MTPHEISIVIDGKVTLTIPASGNVARISVLSEQVDVIDGIPVVKTVYSKESVKGLPATDEGTIYLVSQACPERHGLLVPANLVRDEE